MPNPVFTYISNTPGGAPSVTVIVLGNVYGYPSSNLE